MKRLALALACAACTGQNVDEAFVLTHGATLAELNCSGPMTRVNSDNTIQYQANIFMDGSALVTPTGFSAVQFFSRGNVPADTRILSGPPDTCGLGASRTLFIDGGVLQWWECKTVGAELSSTMDIDTDCTGFNKHLFD